MDEARKVNSLIEQERQRMKQRRDELLNQTINSSKFAHKLEELEPRDTWSRQAATAQPSRKNEVSVNFEDNYEFYMYHLNTSGQLVKPQDQLGLAKDSRLVLKKPPLA